MNKKFEKLLERETIITSPDLDGILTAAILTALYGKKVIGFYDGKRMTYIKEYDPKKAAFVDMEIFNKDIPSLGNHMIVVHRDFYNIMNKKLESCINGNIDYKYDATTKYYNHKYPFGALHLLFMLIEERNPEYIEMINFEKGIWPVIIADGLLNVPDKYPPNFNRWKCGYFKQSQVMQQVLNFVWNELTPSKKFELSNEYWNLLPKEKQGKRGTGFKIEHVTNKEKINVELDYIKVNLDLLGLDFNSSLWEIMDINKNKTTEIFDKVVLNSCAKYKTEPIYINENIISAAVVNQNQFSYTIDQKNILID
jgi:hypothetical protein